MIIRENVKLSEITTMRLGGPADFVIDVESEDDVREAFEFASNHNLPIYFLGSGANSIGLDSGFPGIILRNRIKGFEILKETDSELELKVGGGEIWDEFVAYVSEKGFSGVEAMSKIPGTVAAAPVQNIGAYGQEVKDTLVSVSAFDTLLEEFVEIKKEDCNFSYRSLIFNSGKKKGRFFILSCIFRLERKDLTPPFYNSLETYLEEKKISDFSPISIRKAVSAIRAEKLPDPEEIASAGSFFKNILLSDKEADEAEKKGVPVRRTGKENKVNTGWLLENAGLKGKSFHGFKISEKAALILINESGKSEADLEKAVEEISGIVEEKFGFRLSMEPVKIEEKND